MKVYDLSGSEHYWKYTKYLVTGSSLHHLELQKSSLHLRARNVIKKVYPLFDICEEVPLPGERLFLDFFIPLKRLAIEVHGEQHYKFIPYFHQNIFAWFEQKKRDERKQQWCQLNDIKYTILPYNENDNEWEQHISGRHANVD